jgi:hypothetical protein
LLWAKGDNCSDPNLIKEPKTFPMQSISGIFGTQMIRDGQWYPDAGASPAGATSQEAGGMGFKQIIGIAVGALAGFLIGYFGRCVGGAA